MTLPNSSTTVLPADPSGSRPAYLVRFPEDVWAQLEKSTLSGASVSLSLEDGMQLSIGDNAPIPLTSQPSGSTSEIYLLTQSPNILTPHAIASSRLAFPPSTNSRAVDRLKAQNEANEKERKDRVDRVNGLKKAKPPSLDSAPTPRTISSPLIPPPLSASGSASGGPVIPLKTRVVQLLALGPQSIDDIVARVGMSENEVMRVVNVVGKETMDGYTLQPNKYAQVKIGPWKYTYAEKLRVLKLAKEAFDEMGLPEDADERADLDRKESEVMSGGSSSSERIETPPPVAIPAPSAVYPIIPATAPTPPKKEKAKKTTTGLGLIGKQRAKFAAEKQRASSLPNSKQIDGTASPRLATPPSVPMPDARDLPKVPKVDKEKPGKVDRMEKTEKDAKAERKDKAVKAEKAEPKPVKRKRDDDPAPPLKRLPSPSSTQSSEDARGRSKQAKPVTSGSTQVDGSDNNKRSSRKSRDYSSSEDESKGSKPMRFDRIPRKAAAPAPVPVPTPAPELKLNGHQDGPPDPEALRERYEELYPAYQLLSQKLAKIHRDAETEEEGEVVEMDEKELTKMVTRFEKWHRELEGIRKWFA